MSKKEITTLDQPISCQGISVRTTNKAETEFATAKLGGLWQAFYQNHLPNLDEGAQVYGIYQNYQSGDTGAFDVIASWQTDSYDDAAKNELESSLDDRADKVVNTTIPAGKYLVFSEKGKMPDMVMDAWEKVWTYFLKPDCPHTRTYDVDFEQYHDGNLEYGQVDIYIGVE